LNGVYGVCPRILCHKQTVLPYGISEDLKYCRVSIFCPICQDIYKPRGNVSEMDGGYFGPNFPLHFLHYYSDLNYFKKQQKFVPKLYGFKTIGREGSVYDNNLNRIIPLKEESKKIIKEDENLVGKKGKK
jgi:casein kinase II subunit beta